MNRFIYNLHSWMGLIAGLGLLIIGITGSIIVFKDELDLALYPHLVKQEDAAKPALSLGTFISTAQQNLPGHVIRSFGPPSEPGLSTQAYVTPVGGNEFKVVYIDASTGIPRSNPMEISGTITNWLVELHYTFLADHVGAFVAGLFGLLLFFLGLSGFWLYRNFWKTFFLLRWGRALRIFLSDLHKMIGITFVVFNLVLGFTGAWWNLSHIIGHWIEGEESEAPKVAGSVWAPGISFDALVLKAQEKLPGFNVSWVSLPATPEEDITFFGNLNGQSFLRSPYSSNVTFNAQNGELKVVTDIRQASVVMQILDSFRPLHFGNFGGLWIKILWCIGGLTPAILAISGSIMWWQRKKPTRKKKVRKAVSETPFTSANI